MPEYEHLSRESPEASGYLVDVCAAALLEFGELLKLFDDLPSLTRVGFAGRNRTLVKESGEHSRLFAAVVSHVVKAFVKRKEYVHICAVACESVSERNMTLQRVHGAPSLVTFILGLIEPRQENREKYKVVPKRDLSSDTEGFLKLATYPAVIGVICIIISDLQFVPVDPDVTEHSVSSALNKQKKRDIPQKSRLKESVPEDQVSLHEERL